ncbi:hypothetical protein BDW22DRAFT_1351166 [Trametopsis cervina]|nr:hypothetical protein BDW22DRAFT_1351166 [Trametopsis cervina]
MRSLSINEVFAKKTGDYSVLSTADLCVIALTYALEQKEKLEAEKSAENHEAGSASSSTAVPQESTPEPQESLEQTVSNLKLDDNDDGELAEDTAGSEPIVEDLEDQQAREPLNVEVERIQEDEDEKPLASNLPTAPGQPSASQPRRDEQILYDDPSDEDDGEGEWITPSNVDLHKSRALNLIPDEAGKTGKKKAEQIWSGCMTADFAMQNVLLQMGLSLVGVEGKRIERVKTWVLRCHACFKICKDSSRKFCPSCGNPTLIRASVTLSSPTASSAAPTLQVHLKKNFQYKTRGTIFSIPAPKAGTAKTGSGEGLILREDQSAWMKAKKHADGKREREEKRMLVGTARNGSGAGSVLGSWMDPDWVPEMLSVGAGGKGRSMRSSGYDGDMPVIGHGRKNPNERRRKK